MEVTTAAAVPILVQYQQIPPQFVLSIAYQGAGANAVFLHGFAPFAANRQLLRWTIEGMAARTYPLH